MAEVRKRKRVGSKKTKKGWRRTDVEDVDEYLEDARLQERTGGIVSEKPDEKIFFLDKNVEDKESTKEKRRTPKRLKCYALFEPDEKVAAARVKHNILQPETILKRTSVRVKELRARGITPAWKEQADQNRQSMDKKRKAKKCSLYRQDHSIAQKDLWEDADLTPKQKEDLLYKPNYRKSRPVEHIMARVSEVRAVEVPAPGASYNPTYDDHQDLLRKAHEVEVTKLDVEVKLKRALKPKEPTKTKTTWLEEMSEGLVQRAQSSDEGDKFDDLVIGNPPVRRENKKTRTQRNKERAEEIKKLKLEKEKEGKERKKDLFRIRTLKAELKSRDIFLERKRQKKEQKKKDSKDNPKKLGKLKFTPADLEVKLSEELKGSLRLLKPEGNLLEDRFKSLQKRNIIESRNRAKFRRRYKVKYYENRTHREITT